MSYWNNNGPTSNREAMGEITYMNWREHLNNMAQRRREAFAKRKSLARNALAAQMITTGRGPKPPSQYAPYEHLPPYAAAPAPRPANTNALISNEARNILAMLYNVPVPGDAAAPAAAPAAAGGAGAAPAPPATSGLAVLPSEVRSKIASYLSGVERNHLRSIKANIARETAKIANPRKGKHKTCRNLN